MLTAVGFDLDDTLAVPVRDRATLLSEAITQVDAPPISREAYLDAHGEYLTAETRGPIFEALLPPESDTDPDALAAAYRERVEDALVPVEGAADLVTDLRERYRVGLLTDGPVRAQHGKLEHLGWTELFDAVVVTGSLPAGKPDWRTFDHLLDGLDAPPWTTCYVGDHPEADVRGASEMGLHTVQVVSEDGPDPIPEADAVVERERLATDLPELLAGF